jgi:hypothetical protein
MKELLLTKTIILTVVLGFSTLFLKSKGIFNDTEAIIYTVLIGAYIVITFIIELDKEATND